MTIRDDQNENPDRHLSRTGSDPAQLPTNQDGFTPYFQNHYQQQGESGQRRSSPVSARVVAIATGVIVLAAIIGFGVQWLAGGHGSSPVAATAATTTNTATAPSSLVPLASPAPTRTPSADPSTKAAASTTPNPSASCDPAHVVDAYYEAINTQNYKSAWQLGGDKLGESYSAFVSGFTGTVNDAVRATNASATTASVELTATEKNGDKKQFTGTYTVTACVITGAHIAAAG